MPSPPDGSAPAAGARRRGPRARLVSVYRSARSWTYLDLGHSVADTTFLAGSGRSGTTWLQEVIDRHHDHRIMFEPFTPHRVRSVAAFAPIQYIRADDLAPGFVDPVARILEGRIHNGWIDHQTHVRVARRRLVKDIRSNLMLAWLRARFPDMKVVWLIRHPGAVVASALSMGWRPHLASLLGQPELVADHLQPHLATLQALSTPFEQIVAQWCIEQYVPFRDLRPGDVHVVQYEALVRDPVTVGGAVLSYLGQGSDAALDDALDRPSRLAGASSAVRTGRDPVTAWRDGSSTGDLAVISDLLGRFGLDALYTGTGEAAPGGVASVWRRP